MGGFAVMWWLFALLLLHRVNTQDCPNAAITGRNTTGPRSPRVFTDLVGLDEAKEVLKEAVVLPASMPASLTRLFWRSGERSAVLLVGPSGLGKVAVIEAAATEAGALVLPLAAVEVASSGFCRVALSTARSKGQPVVVIVEALDSAPSASLAIRQCLQEAAENDDTMSRVFVVATMSHDLQSLSATALVPFGYVVRLSLPSDSERLQFLHQLFKQISRIDREWFGLREAAVQTLANLTSRYTFGEIELMVRRTFIRSTNNEGTRDPVALHHFEQILAAMPPQAHEAFNETYVAAEPTASATSTGSEVRKSTDASKKKPKEVKDPMDGIFGWCNFWLPEALHLPPVVWAMIIFGILAHFMARSTYQPYGHRGKRGRGNRHSFGLSDQLGGGSGFGAGGLGGDDFMSGSNWMGAMGGAGSFPYPGPPGMEGLTRPGAGRGESETSSASNLPSAGEPKAAAPPQ